VRHAIKKIPVSRHFLARSARPLYFRSGVQMLIFFFRLSLFPLLTIWIWIVSFRHPGTGRGERGIFSSFFFLTSYCRALDLICSCFFTEFYPSISSSRSHSAHGSRVTVVVLSAISLGLVYRRVGLYRKEQELRTCLCRGKCGFGGPRLSFKSQSNYVG
jgi:hypothetical protein